MNNDIMNALFEFIGGLFLWMNVLTLYKDKVIKGVYYPTVIFFFLWGIWNLWYYPSLNQWWSFAGGLWLATANLVWILLFMYYKFKENINEQ